MVPEPFDVQDDQHLVAMDVKSQLSVNGARVADMMIGQVPDASLFCTTLRVVKHWAKRRGIYSNIHGYLGGFSWALLVSYVCRSNARCRAAPDMLAAFFRTFAFWNWDDGPVCLVPPVVDHPLQLPDWRTGRAAASMTVLTPAYPSQNSTFNVRPVTRDTIVSELKRAHELLAPSALLGDRAGIADLLTAVCAPSSFFSAYRSFIELEMTARDPSALKAWCLLLSHPPPSSSLSSSQHARACVCVCVCGFARGRNPFLFFFGGGGLGGGEGVFFCAAQKGWDGASSNCAGFRKSCGARANCGRSSFRARSPTPCRRPPPPPPLRRLPRRHRRLERSRRTPRRHGSARRFSWV